MPFVTPQKADFHHTLYEKWGKYKKRGMKFFTDRTERLRID